MVRLTQDGPAGPVEILMWYDAGSRLFYSELRGQSLVRTRTPSRLLIRVLGTWN